MELSTDPPLSTWSDPACALRVIYPLPLFYEIEFLASEGYRRIPHGGIEHGGILYGRTQDGAIRIEAFRAIECEHAFGPSFVLSTNDIEGLKAQLLHAPSDPKLNGLTPLGWFISHSRSGLEVTNREWEWFDSLFPEPWQVLLLIKPEKFKPTRFAFALREGRYRQNDLMPNAFVLPLPGRSDRTKHAARRQREQKTPEYGGQTLERPAPAPRGEPEETAPIAANTPSAPRPEQRIDRPILPGPRQRPLALWLSCLVCCLLVLASGLRFYWKYSASPLPLHAIRQDGRLLISWPSETGATSGELIIQNGGSTRTMELSAGQMRSGGAAISDLGRDLGIELIARHWLHKEHGMLRVLTPK